MLPVDYVQIWRRAAMMGLVFDMAMTNSREKDPLLKGSFGQD
jgi:hypothetical protein